MLSDMLRTAAGGSNCSARTHGWAKLLCPHNDPDCRCGEFCITVVWGTPRSPENHARQLRRVVDGCIRRREEPEDVGE
jgi:hypothetical protein